MSKQSNQRYRKELEKSQLNKKNSSNSEKNNSTFSNNTKDYVTPLDKTENTKIND